MNEAMIAGIIGLVIVAGFSISVVVKIQSLQKMAKTNSTPLLGVIMPQETATEKKRGK